MSILKSAGDCCDEFVKCVDCCEDFEDSDKVLDCTTEIKDNFDSVTAVTGRSISIYHVNCQ